MADQPIKRLFADTFYNASTGRRADVVEQPDGTFILRAHSLRNSAQVGMHLADIEYADQQTATDDAQTYISIGKAGKTTFVV